MHWGLYLKGQTVFAPTTGRPDQPVYREMEPIDVVALSNPDSVRRHPDLCQINPAWKTGLITVGARHL